jgi:peptidoglycan/LPS O-acetylase OafA/YrhL
LDAHSQRIAYFPALTGLRGVAAGAVLVFHLWQFAGKPEASLAGYPLHGLAQCGYLGVDLFFVLSGFLLGLPFLAAVRGLRRWPSLGTYLVRRARRVLPALWVQIALLFGLGWLVAGAPPFGLKTALVHALFLQHLVRDAGVINPVYWTLPVEWWFYFTLPVLALGFRWMRWWILLAGVLLFVVLFRLWCAEWLAEGRWDIGFNYGSIMHLRARYDQFFLGVLAAWFHLAAPAAARVRGALAGFALLGLLALVPSLAARGDLFIRADYPWLLAHYTVVGTLLAALVWGAAGSVRWLDALLANRLVAWLGLISYSLYLWHYPVLSTVQRLGWLEPGRRSLGVLAALGGALLVSWLSYRFVERPFLQEYGANGRAEPAPRAASA